jgi:hypothetical protein
LVIDACQVTSFIPPTMSQEDSHSLPRSP